MDATARPTRRRFMLTGFMEREKLQLITIIKSLNAAYIADSLNSQVFIPSCTHVIAKKPCRSEKFLCACASGKWLLVDKYLYDSSQAKQFLKEEEYEWGQNNFISNLPRDVQEAPRRWRLALGRENPKPPFHRWKVGVLASNAVSVYKRLIEVGGGQASNLKTSKKTETFTHLIADSSLLANMKQFHERGIPCLRCEYLAQFLLQDPPPSTSEFSLFLEDKEDHVITEVGSQSQDTTASLSDIVCDAEAETRLQSRILKDNNNNNNNTGKDADKADSCDTDGTVASLSQATATNSANESENNNIDNFGSSVLQRDSVAADSSITADTCIDGKEASKTDGSDVGTLTVDTRRQAEKCVCVVQLSPLQNSTISNIQKLSLKEVDADVLTGHGQDAMSVDIPGMSSEPPHAVAHDTLGNNTAEIENNSASLSSANNLEIDGNKMSQSPPTSSADDDLDIETPSSNARRINGATSRSIVTHRCTQPDWLAQKKAPKNIQGKIKDSRNESHCDVTMDSAARRFGKREMTMLENFVDVGHTRSVLLTCRMLVSSTAYPPPDLLYLLMKKYLLDSESKTEATQTIAILNTILLLHPPTTSHIRHDDVYLQAMGITAATESSLLSVAELNLNRKIQLWSEAKHVSAERKFFCKIVKQAMRAGDPQRRLNAVALLTFVTSLAEEDPQLMKRLFWPGSKRRRHSSGLQTLLKFTHEAIVAHVRLSQTVEDNNDENEEEEEKEEDVASGSDVTTDDEDTDDDVIDEYDNRLMTSDVVNCLTRILHVAHSQISQETGEDCPGGSDDVIASGLAEVFHDADHVTVERLLRIVKPTLVTSLARAFLELNFSDDLTGIKKNNMHISMQLLVDRYMQMLPKPPNLVAMDLEQPASVSGENIRKKYEKSLPENSDQSESSDKENVHFLKVKTSSVSTSLDSGGRLSSANINRKNPKGETPLHRACMQNQPARVAQLLKVDGVNPNARDNAGWTPLSEACNHGHVACVEELLRLPLAAPTSAATPNDVEKSTPALEVDLLACPEEGITPLHDALNNGHIEVARLLMEKGGVELLYVDDKKGLSPLDICSTEDMKSLVIEIACEIGSMHYGRTKTKSEDEIEVGNQEKRFRLASEDDYVKALPPVSLMMSSEWNNACSLYITLLRHLVSTYITESGLLQTILRILSEKDNDDEKIETEDNFPRDVTTKTPPNAPGNPDVPAEERRPAENAADGILLSHKDDLAYLRNWREVEEIFQKHLQRITGDPTFVFDGFPFLNANILTRL